MTLLALCEQIGIPCNTVKLDYAIDELILAYDTDRVSFFQTISSIPDYEQKLLQLFLTLATRTYTRYQELGIPDNIFFDTMRDITVWAENNEKAYDVYGIREYNWLWLHIEMKLFRLGRLQFELTQLPHTVPTPMSIPSGSKVLNIHIPQGEPLSYELCLASYAQAYSFFKGITPLFTCHSWLLNPLLSTILPQDSNIVKFQSDFFIYKTDLQDRQCEERVFGSLLSNPHDYPEQTSLQKKIKKLLINDQQMGTSYGVFLFSETDFINI